MTVDSGKRAFCPFRNLPVLVSPSTAAFPAFVPLYPNLQPHRFFFFLRLLVSFRLEPAPHLGPQPPTRPPTLPPSALYFIFPFICRLRVFSLITWFPPGPGAPLPRAFLFPRAPFKRVCPRRSSGVIELMIAS